MRSIVVQGMLIVVLLLVLVGITIANKDKPDVISETPITGVEFIDASGTFDDHVFHVETDSESFVLRKGEVAFIKAGTDGEFRYVHRQRKNPFTIFTFKEHVIFVPERYVKTISSNYATTYKQTLEFETED